MARSNEPLWWGPFSAGMMIGALCVPALIVITGLLLPWLYPYDAARVQTLINRPLTRVVLFVVISLSLFHWAHRFRYILFDLGLKGGRTAVAVACYGAAIVGTVVAAARFSCSVGSGGGSAKKLTTVWLRGSRPFSTRTRCTDSGK